MTFTVKDGNEPLHMSGLEMTIYAPTSEKMEKVKKFHELLLEKILLDGEFGNQGK